MQNMALRRGVAYYSRRYADRPKPGPRGADLNRDGLCGCQQRVVEIFNLDDTFVACMGERDYGSGVACGFVTVFGICWVQSIVTKKT